MAMSTRTRPGNSCASYSRALNNCNRTEQVSKERGRELEDAHRRVRQAAQVRGLHYRVEPQQPTDILGVYLYLPNQTQ